MITYLRVQNFRRHKDMSVNFQAGATIITGPNGSGKTSLLEAIYVAIQGKSWRSPLSEITRRNQSIFPEWWRVDVELNSGDNRVVKMSGKDVVFEINGKQTGRLPKKYKKPVIFFEPNDLQLLYGSPSRRRDFFDRFIDIVEPGYGAVLRRFERVLAQRNKLLKLGATQDRLFAWDIQFAELSEKILTQRQKWTKRINTRVTQIYNEIAKNNDVITVRYTAPRKTSQEILNSLHNEFQEGLLFTRTGPHIHDVEFLFNNRSAKQTASRGENRTILFAVLGAMTEAVNEYLNDTVYLLFDDVDSELDAERRKQLYKMKVFEKNHLFVTTIDTTVSPTNLLRLD